MMNNKIKSENHRKLSISVLVTSIMAISVVGLYNFFGCLFPALYEILLVLLLFLLSYNKINTILLHRRMRF